MGRAAPCRVLPRPLVSHLCGARAGRWAGARTGAWVWAQAPQGKRAQAPAPPAQSCEPPTDSPPPEQGVLGAPEKEGQKVPSQRAGSWGSEAARQFLPLPPWAPVTWGCFHLRLTSALPTSASTRLQPGVTRTSAHACEARPRTACVGVTLTHTSRGVYFWADPRGRVSSSGVREMVRGGWPASVTPADWERKGRAGPQTWRLGTLRPPWAPKGRLALGAQWKGGGRSRGGNGKQGSASSSGHAL